MKTTSLFILSTIAGMAFTPETGWAQQALKTDTSGNPLTAFNLGGTNVTGTISPARLPGSLVPPVVLNITQTEGNLTLTAGTNVAVLTAPLTGPLNVTLPLSGPYTAGRALVVVDPGGYSSATYPVMASPGAGNLLNADSVAFAILAGTGAASLQPDGANGWSTGQSYLRVPSLAGLTLAGAAVGGDETLLSVRNGNGAETLSARGDGTTAALYLQLDGTLTCDGGSLGTDGSGGLAAENFTAADSVAATTFVLSSVAGGRSAPVPAGQVNLYYDTDGFLHVRTPDGANHVLSWTTP